MAFHQDYLGVEPPAIGQLIRALRHTLPLTQEQFAAPLSVRFPTINRWENGYATPSPLALRQIELLLHQLVSVTPLTLRVRTQALKGKDVLASTLPA